MTLTRVEVVGGGIVGASIAYHLARAGAAVTVRFRDAGVTASSFAWIGGTGTAWPGGAATLRDRVLPDWRRLAAAVPGVEVRWPGSLSWPAPAVVPAGQQLIGAAEAAALEPALRTVPDTAVHIPGDGTVDAAAAARALLLAARTLGARIVSGAEVVRPRQLTAPAGSAALAAPTSPAVPTPLNSPAAPTSLTSSAAPTSPTSPAAPTSLTSSAAPTSPTSPAAPTSLSSSAAPTSPTSPSSPTSSGEVPAVATPSSEVTVLAAGTGVTELSGGRVTVPSSPAFLMRLRGPAGLVRSVISTPHFEVREDHPGHLLATAPLGRDRTWPGLRCLAGDTTQRLRAAFGADLRLTGWSVGERPMPADGPVIGFLDASTYVAVMHSAVCLAPVVGRLVAGEILTGRPAPELAGCRP